jgi:hypothetical protein
MRHRVPTLIDLSDKPFDLARVPGATVTEAPDDDRLVRRRAAVLQGMISVHSAPRSSLVSCQTWIDAFQGVVRTLIGVLAEWYLAVNSDWILLYAFSFDL